MNKKAVQLQIFVLLFLILFSSSCSTILNTSKQDIQVTSNPPGSIVCIEGDTCLQTPTKFKVKRSKEDLKLIVTNDSIDKKIEVDLESKYAPEFVWGNLFNLGFIGPLGYAIDIVSEGRRYAYKKAVHIDLVTGEVKYRIPKVDYKKSLFVGLSLPVANSFNFNNGYKKDKLSGGPGIYGTLEYYYDKNRYLSGRIGIVTNDLNLYNYRYDYYNMWGYEKVSCFFLRLNNMYDFNIVRVGAGLHFSSYMYDYEFFGVVNSQDLYVSESYNHSYNTFGLSLTAELRFLKILYLGFDYHPSIMSYERNHWVAEYSHLFSFAFGGRVNLTRVFDSL